MKIAKIQIIIAVVCFAIIPFCTSIISSYYFSKASSKPVEIRKKLDVKDDGIVGSNTLSVYLETEEGSGEYRLSEEDVFLHDGYTFNEEKSKCENGGTLAYDKTTGNIRMSTVASDRCFVYFDKGVLSMGKVCKNQNMAQCIKENYNLNNNEIYYHDSTLANGAGDSSYRYAGASDTVNNYVCFGMEGTTCDEDHLYRIIGVFDDNTDGEYNIKLIKNKSLGNMAFDTTKTYGSNMWEKSEINKNTLNGTYLTGLGSYANMIRETTWNVGGHNTNEATAKTFLNAEKSSQASSSKIGLMYLSDYGYAAYPDAWTTNLSSYSNATITANNWLFTGKYTWAIMPYSSYYLSVISVYNNGNATVSLAHNNFAVQPVLYLNSNIVLKGGNGTSNSPYIIGE